jgi:hypothetical protein
VLRRVIPRTSLSVRLSMAVLSVGGMTQCAVGQHADATPPPIAAAGQPGRLPEDIEQVLWWLPEKTEAVLVSRGSVPIPEKPAPLPAETVPQEKVRGGPSVTLPPGPEYLRSGREYQDLVAIKCTEVLGYYNPKLYPEDLQLKMMETFYGPKTARLFVKAVWWDKDTSRETCDLVVFRDNMAARIIDTLAVFPNTPRNIDALRVLEVDLNYGRTPESEPHPPIPLDWNDLPPRPKRRYLAAPRANVYVAATSSELLKVIVERMKQSGPERALPPDLPEWRYLDPTVPAWGLRHYRRAIADKDCLSMLRWDPNAQGLVMFGGNKPSPFIGLRYVSNSKDAASRFLQMEAGWLRTKDASRMAPMQRISTDCVETRTRINLLPAAQANPWRTLPVYTTSLCMDFMYLPWLGFSCPKLAIQTE